MRLQDVTQSVNQVDTGKRRHGRYSINTEHCLMTSDVARCQNPPYGVWKSSSAAFTHQLQTKLTNDVRYRMFQKGTKDQEKLPPSRKCLEQHIKRAHHQAQVWFQADVPIPEIESPIGSGWYEDATRRLHPHVSVDDPLPNEFTDIVCCKCKTCATSRCSCRAKNLKCIAACTCNNGVCHNPYSVAIETDSE
ncbi:hypothetical protein GWK47_049625 [Chionoecetes opilio]|uniref:Tesmin/TSO1-like CXC domain-containing protein n=1 Tax=Chionoecetes opilio TaxID=41210 RepID=A0A8J4Y392_CHIOP|nr:hypothetical protein GWK47_049625 [Chionoecetes opilio]